MSWWQRRIFNRRRRKDIRSCSMQSIYASTSALWGKRAKQDPQWKRWKRLERLASKFVFNLSLSCHERRAWSLVSEPVHHEELFSRVSLKRCIASDLPAGGLKKGSRGSLHHGTGQHLCQKPSGRRPIDPTIATWSQSKGS